MAGQNSAIKMLPADDQQREFAAEVQQRLPSEARVSFYRTETEQGGKRYGVIYQYGSARHTELSSTPPYDSDGMVREIMQWIAAPAWQHRSPNGWELNRDVGRRLFVLL